MELKMYLINMSFMTIKLKETLTKSQHEIEIIPQLRQTAERNKCKRLVNKTN